MVAVLKQNGPSEQRRVPFPVIPNLVIASSGAQLQRIMASTRIGLFAGRALGRCSSSSHTRLWEEVSARS